MKKSGKQPKDGQVSRQPDVEDSASAADVSRENKDTPQSTGKKPPNRGRRGGKPSRGSDTLTESSNDSRVNERGQMFNEGSQALLSYGLSVSGRKERILSLIKSDKYFHFAEQAWQAFLTVKPAIAEHFSYAEFKHLSALMLYGRIEYVKYDAIGVKPSAPTRIPLPKDLRVYQPIWSVLAEIGVIEDEDLRVCYIPDGQLPKTNDLQDPADIEGLVACTLYDWVSSWEDVRAARARRPEYAARFGMSEAAETNEGPDDQVDLMTQIADLRRRRSEAINLELSGDYTVINGILQRIKYRKDENGNDLIVNNRPVRENPANYLPEEGQSSAATIDNEIRALHDRAVNIKKRMTTIRYDVETTPAVYATTDNIVTADPGAYGAWLHWDPRLWLEYEQIVEVLQGVCLFSLSMPAETTGTYAWILPVESREDQPNSVFCKMPKASISPRVLTLALLLQSSTLAEHHRSTWYCETDVLSNVLGLRQRYVRAGIKRAAPVDQYGIY